MRTRLSTPTAKVEDRCFAAGAQLHAEALQCKHLVTHKIIRRLATGANHTRLVGRAYSLREYVWADDIGEYVARRVYTNAQSQETPHVLAQGKPSSVFEIQRTVESVMGRRTYISFDLEGDNSRHTTFAPTALPLHWRPQSIAFGVRAIVEDFRSYRRAA